MGTAQKEMQQLQLEQLVLTGFWNTYSTDALMFIFTCGTSTFSQASFPAFYEIVCQFQYASAEVCETIIAEGGDATDQLQADTSRWAMFSNLAFFVTSSLSALLFGNYGDRIGWCRTRAPLLLAISSSALHAFIFCLLATDGGVHPAIFALLNAVAGLGGGFTVFLLAQFSRVAAALQLQHSSDAAAANQKLMVRFSVLTAFWSLGTIAGSYLAGNLLQSEWSFSDVMVIGMAIEVLALLMTLTLGMVDHESMNDTDLAKKENSSASKVVVQTTWEQKHDESQSQDLHPAVNGSFCNPTAFLSVAAEYWHSIADSYAKSYATITRRRCGNRRLFVALILLVYVAYSSEDGGLDDTLSLYLFNAPFSFSPQQRAYFSAAQFSLDLVGGLGGALLLKHVINLKADHVIVLIGLFSSMAKMTAFGFSRTAATMYTGLVLGTISTVGFPALRALLVQMGDPQETGQLISTFSIVGGFSPLFSALVYNNLYTATVASYSGTVFLCCAALLSLAAFAIFATMSCDISRRQRHVFNASAKTEMSRSTEEGTAETGMDRNNSNAPV